MMTKQLTAIVFLLLSLTACQNRNNPEAINAINKGLNKANEVVAKNNGLIYEALNEKCKDPQTEVSASVWTPKALAVKKLSADINKYIDSLEQLLKEEDASDVDDLFRKEGDNLYHKLVGYTHEVVHVLKPEEFEDNPYLQANLKKVVESFKEDLAARFELQADSASEYPTGQKSWRAVHLDGSTPLLAIAMLNKIQNDVLVTEFSMLEYIHNQIAYRTHGWENFHAIAILNSSYVKAGQSIEVSAGIGVFSAAAKPTIHINGASIKLNDDGVAVCNLIATGHAGKHTVPVKIEYTKPDGSTASVIRNLEYIIAE